MMMMRVIMGSLTIIVVRVMIVIRSSCDRRIVDDQGRSGRIRGMWLVVRECIVQVS